MGGTVQVLWVLDEKLPVLLSPGGHCYTILNTEHCCGPTTDVEKWSDVRMRIKMKTLLFVNPGGNIRENKLKLDMEEDLVKIGCLE